MVFQQACILKEGLPNDGRRGLRLELDEFLQDNEMTNLFLVALSQMQQDSLVPVKLNKNTGKKFDEKKDKEEDSEYAPNWMNYYGLAGIHGEPREAWNDYKNPGNPTEFDVFGLKVPNDFPGFCHHNRDTFPIWHRPYTAMFEMAVYEKMVEVAKQYEGSDWTVYEAAAARFRMPYWDPLMPRYKQRQNSSNDSIMGTPKILAVKQVYVWPPVPRQPGELDLIDNPLYSFRYPTAREYAEPHAKDRPKIKFEKEFSPIQTLRCPSDSGDTDSKMFNLAIQRHAVGHANAMLFMLHPDQEDLPESGEDLDKKQKINKLRSFSTFASDKVYSASIETEVYKTLAVESFHDMIHLLISIVTSAPHLRTGRTGALDTGFKTVGQGAMADTAYAAYDPIFPLLHNNVDRILALYQALYPEKWLEGEKLTAQLFPFAKDATGNCWTPNDKYIREYWHCGYAIPGTQEPTEASKPAIREKVIEYLAYTYLPTASLNRIRVKLDNWPKDLSNSWALYDRKKVEPAKPSQPPAMQMTALQLDSSGDAKLVRITGEAEATPIENVLQKLEDVDVSLPKGVFSEYRNSKPFKQTTWNAYIKLRKYAFNGPYTVHLFIGHIKETQPERYMTKKNEVGYTAVFTTSAEQASRCANCLRQRDEDIRLSDVIPLTSILYDYLKDAPNSENLIRDASLKTIDDMTPESVVPFLKENLRWAIIDASANLIEGGEVQAGLEVVVASRDFEVPTKEYLMGKYGPITLHPEITSSKRGGYMYNGSSAT